MRLLTLIIPIGGLVLWLLIFPSEKVNKNTPKMNGASLVNPRNEISQSQMAELKNVNADWVAVIPYAFARAGEPSVSFNHERQWWGERTDGTAVLIRMAQENGMKVMLKPHVWVRGEGWAGDFTLDQEEDWKVWERDFSRYILHFAKLADSLDVELFCLGTEYRIPAKDRPKFWRQLISEIRNIYDGKITYASNWDNYMKITWWDAVDYIGIDAYFPLIENLNPTTDQLVRAWKPIVNELESFSGKWEKPILFTEYGFQSMDGAAGRHWEIQRDSAVVNHQLQADAYEATFQTFMDQSWYAGGFFWKWYFFQRSGERYATDWTPQNKMAEKVIAKWYGLNKDIQ